MDKFLVCKECAQGMDLQIKLEEGNDQEKFVDYVEDYCQLTPSYEQKGVRKLHQYFKKKLLCQTTYHQDLFCMYISEHSNGLSSTIEFRCNRKKQDKHVSNHHFPLHLPQQTKDHSGDPRYL